MKVYIVTSGAYSDYQINAIFSTKENAERYNKIYASGDFEDIEEFEVDDEMALINRIIDEKITIYLVCMDRDGNIKEVMKESPSVSLVEELLTGKQRPVLYADCMDMCVIAKDEKHAIKIVNEKRVQLIANNEWDKKGEMNK